MPTSVLLTGATGFLGGHLARALAVRGDRVVATVRPTSRRDALAALGARIHVVDAATPAEALLAEHAVDVVVHAATAYGRRGESVAQVVETNVAWPVRLLEAAAARGALFLNLDTFSAKGTELPEGLALYTLTKRQLRELGALQATRSEGRFANLQLEHMYGPGDAATKFFPALIDALLEGRERYALTAGAQRRDFVHVDDVVRAILTVIDARAQLSGYVTFEVGTGESTSLREAVELTRELAGAGTALDFGALPYRAGELMASRADTMPLRALGWAPRLSLRDGLAHTIAAARVARDTSLVHETAIP